MGHFINRDGRTLYVDSNGVCWNGPDKKERFDPQTFSLLNPNENDEYTILTFSDTKYTEENLKKMGYEKLLQLSGMGRGPGSSRKKCIKTILSAQEELDGSTDSTDISDNN